MVWLWFECNPSAKLLRYRQWPTAPMRAPPLRSSSGKLLMSFSAIMLVANKQVPSYSTENIDLQKITALHRDRHVKFAKVIFASPLNKFLRTPLVVDADNCCGSYKISHEKFPICSTLLLLINKLMFLRLT